jgi:hypothetical protein
MFASNPLLHRPGTGAATPAEAASEAGGSYTGHIPTVEAVVLVLAAGVLVWLKRADFRFVVSGGVGKKG